MKRAILIFAVILFAATVPSSAKGVTKSYDLKNFTGIKVAGAIEVELIQSDTYQVSMEMPSDYVQYFKISVSQGVLKADFDNLPRKLRSYGRNDVFKLTVMMPEVKTIRMSGATKLTCEGGFTMPSGELDIEANGASAIRNFSFTAREVEMELSGACSLNGEIRCQKLDIESSGASKVTLKGESEELDLDFSGASNIDSRSFSAESVEVDLSGASHAKVAVLRALKVDMSGASKLEYYTDGPIELDVVDISGACTFRKGSK